MISTKDKASLNIKECLLELYPFKETGVFETHPVYELKNIKIYTIETKGLSDIQDITASVQDIVAASNIHNGLVNVVIHINHG